MVGEEGRNLENERGNSCSLTMRERERETRIDQEKTGSKERECQLMMLQSMDKIK
jgi:hypothetical protein